MFRRGVALVVKGLSPEVSNLLSRVQIPASALSKNAYLQAYSASGADGVITEAERRILLATADALNITHERAAELEDGFDPKVADNAPQVVTEPTAVQQWTDEAGHTWRSMDDGTIMWWNGTDWQQV